MGATGSSTGTTIRARRGHGVLLADPPGSAAGGERIGTWLAGHPDRDPVRLPGRLGPSLSAYPPPPPLPTPAAGLRTEEPLIPNTVPEPADIVSIRSLLLTLGTTITAAPGPSPGGRRYTRASAPSVERASRISWSLIRSAAADGHEAGSPSRSACSAPRRRSSGIWSVPVGRSTAPVSRSCPSPAVARHQLPARGRPPRTRRAHRLPAVRRRCRTGPADDVPGRQTPMVGLLREGCVSAPTDSAFPVRALCVTADGTTVPSVLGADHPGELATGRSRVAHEPLQLGATLLLGYFGRASQEQRPDATSPMIGMSPFSFSRYGTAPMWSS